jgi:RNA polymerase sigma factor (TIGR02999 family)
MSDVVCGGRRRLLAPAVAPLRTPSASLMFSRTNCPAPGRLTRATTVRTLSIAPGAMADATSRTEVLTALRAGDERSLDRVVSMLYDELRLIAHRQLARTRPYNGSDRPLVTTELVNEAYLRLVNQEQATWSDRTHFLALAAVAMRHVLIDRARAQAADRRGGGQHAVTLDDAVSDGEQSPQRLLEIDDALTRLAEVSPRLARVVECRFYGGLSEEEIAAALDITVRTVQRDWVKARALLRRALAE